MCLHDLAPSGRDETPMNAGGLGRSGTCPTGLDPLDSALGESCVGGRGVRAQSEVYLRCRRRESDSQYVRKLRGC